MMNTERRILTYRELSKLQTFEDRLAYLRINGKVGEDTFGFDRIFNQQFYKSGEWRTIRDYVIVRDEGCDLGCKDREIQETILIHHMNPISIDDISESTEYLLNPEYLITTVLKTHNFIHYGVGEVSQFSFTERKPNDTCPWRR